jgi:hypothetical protein
MRIALKDIPQADRLHDVVATVGAVAAGSDSDAQIATAIGKRPRQGRYYRRAAEILGFLRRAAPNRSVLTPLGQQLLRARGRSRDATIAAAVLRCEVVRRAISLLESRLPARVARAELEDFIARGVQTAGDTLIPRRTSTLVSWLEEIKILAAQKGDLILKGLPPGVELLDHTRYQETLFPRAPDLSEHEEVPRWPMGGRRAVGYLIDHTKRERAHHCHRMLTRLVARKIRLAGAIPKRSPLIDLAANLQGLIYLFEIKSITATNERAQVRRGLSQLYEYRYLYRLPKARLVLVIQNPLSARCGWMADYLMSDREVFLAWDGDGRNLSCSDPVRGTLAFLVS